MYMFLVRGVGIGRRAGGGWELLITKLQLLFHVSHTHTHTLVKKTVRLVFNS